MICSHYHTLIDNNYVTFFLADRVSCFVERVYSLKDLSDPDSVVEGVELALSIIDNIERAGDTVVSLRRRLVSLFEFWTAIQSNSYTC